jgi:hypothetical protein
MPRRHACLGAKRLFVVGEEVEDDVSLAYPPCA